jgi:hypothetical protein
MLALASGGLLLCTESSHAYRAQIGWLHVTEATGYKLLVGFDGATPQSIDIGALAREPDGLCRVVVAGLPMGPSADFSVTSYDTDAMESLPSNGLSIPYGDAAVVVDSDRDGLTDAQEDRDLDQTVDVGETDPRTADSDGDGLDDGDEVAAGSDPTDADSPGSTPACDPGSCDDGNACNGIEHCDPEAGCVAGQPPTCNNGIYCDGSERCDPARGCTSGTAPNCSDGISCTEDICDEAADACTNIPRANRCDDGDVCTDDRCDPSAGCSTTANSASCNDGLSCTSADVCNGGLCSGVENCPSGEICGPQSGLCASSNADTDNDGLSNANDPCPDDARNVCFGPVALDQSQGSIIRINSNSSKSDCAGRRTDCRGDVWVPDFGYNSSARPRSCNQGRNRWHCTIEGVSDLFGCSSEQTLDLFRCAMSDLDGSDVAGYSFDVPPGRYLLNLYFANVRPNGAAVGARVFDIVVEGETVYSAFDPVVAAGGSETALVRSSVVDLADEDGLQIRFNARQGKTIVNAIELLTKPDAAVNAKK